MADISLGLVIVGIIFALLLYLEIIDSKYGFLVVVGLCVGITINSCKDVDGTL